MIQSLRIMVLAIFSFLSLSTFAQSHLPKCIPSSHGKYLLTAFYYGGATLIQSSTLEHHKIAIKHLDALFFSPSFLGIIKDNDEFKLAKITKQNLTTIHQWMKKNNIHTKLILSLGHWGPDEMREVFTKKEVQDAFIKSLVAILKNPAYDIGGVDIDWENFFSSHQNEKKQFPAFLKALRSAFNDQHLTQTCLSVDLPIAPDVAKQYPSPKKWVSYVDWANLMAYEFYGGNPPYTELDGALGNVTVPYPDKAPDYSIISIATTLPIYTKRGIPKRKLVVVLPFYGGMDYISNVGPANHYGLHEKIIDDRPTMSNIYASIYDHYGIYGKSKKGAIIHQYTFEQPASARGKHAYWITHLIMQSKTVGSFYAFLSYPDPKAVKETAEFIKEQGYLGLSAWQLTYDISFDNPNSLLNTLYKTLH